jgi:hypothetical protein
MCCEWCEATDLWYEVGREPRYSELAAQCGIEAALTAGLLELAEYFYVTLSDMVEMPQFISPLLVKNLGIKEARVRYYSEFAESKSRLKSKLSGADFFRLHLYRESIRSLLTGNEFRNKPKQVASLLARAYAHLGLHASLVGLYKAHRQYLESPEITDLVNRAERLLSRKTEAPIKNIRRFQEQHPAGATLTALIARYGHLTEKIK